MSIGSWVFNGFDIVVLLVVFISMLMAASRGFFRELISITAMIVGLIATLFVWGRYRHAVQDIIQPNWLADGALGAGCFFLSYMLVVFVLKGLSKSLRGKEVGFIDRIMGAGFGALRGLVVAALAVMVVTANYREEKEMQDYSRSLTPEMRQSFETAPESVREMLRTDKEVKLPEMLQDSTLYPILDRIGDVLRRLPFSEFKTMARKLKDGESLSEIAAEIQR